MTGRGWRRAVGLPGVAYFDKKDPAAEYLRSKGATASPPTVASGEPIAQVGAGVMV